MKNDVQANGPCAGLCGDQPTGDGMSQDDNDIRSAGEQEKQTLATALEPDDKSPYDDKQSKAGAQPSARGQSFDEQMKPEPEVVDVRWKVAAYLEVVKIIHYFALHNYLLIFTHLASLTKLCIVLGILIRMSLILISMSYRKGLE